MIRTPKADGELSQSFLRERQLEIDNNKMKRTKQIKQKKHSCRFVFVVHVASLDQDVLQQVHQVALQIGHQPITSPRETNTFCRQTENKHFS